MRQIEGALLNQPVKALRVKQAVNLRPPAWKAGGRKFTASSPAPRVNIVSLLAGEKSPGDNQAVLGKARRRCVCVHKSVQRHPALARVTSNRLSSPCPGCATNLLRSTVPAEEAHESALHGAKDQLVAFSAKILLSGGLLRTQNLY